MWGWGGGFRITWSLLQLTALTSWVPFITQGRSDYTDHLVPYGRLWLAPGSYLRKPTPGVLRRVRGSHLGSQLSSCEGDRENSQGSHCHPSSSKASPPPGGEGIRGWGCYSTLLHHPGLSVQLVGQPVSLSLLGGHWELCPAAAAPDCLTDLRAGRSSSSSGGLPGSRHHRGTRPPGAAPAECYPRGGKAGARPAHTWPACLTEVGRRARALAHARAQGSRAPAAGPGGGTARRRAGRGARGARAPHPRAAERYFGWQEAPRHFRRAARRRAGGSTPARQASERASWLRPCAGVSSLPRRDPRRLEP